MASATQVFVIVTMREAVDMDAKAQSSIYEAVQGHSACKLFQDRKPSLSSSDALETLLR